MVFDKPAHALWTLAGVRFMEAAASGAMVPFVVLWAHRDVGLTGAWAGTLFLGQAVGEFTGGVAAGGMADRVGHRRVLLLSTAGMAVGYGLLAVAAVPWVAIVLFLLAGVFESAFHPTVAALVGDVVADEQLPRAFGVLRIGANAGRLVGPLLGAVAALAELPAVFAVAGGMLVVAVVVELLLLPGDRRLEVADADEDPEVPPGTLRALRTDSRLLTLVLAGGLLSIAFAWFEADGLVVLRQQAPLGDAAYAALFTIAAAVVVGGQLPVTRLIDRWPARRALMAGAAAQALGLGALAAAHRGYVVLVAAVVIMTLGEMIYSPTMSTVVTRRAGPGRHASYQAALSITEDIGTAVGPVSGLALAGVTTAAGVWVLGAGASVVAGLFGRAAAARASRGRSDAPAAVRR